MKGPGRRTEKREDYAAIRSDVKNGDLLLFQGRSWTSKIIRCITRSKYSHVGVAMWWKPLPESPPRLMVFEAVRRGVVCSQASKAVDLYSGQVDRYILVPEAEAKISRDKVFAMCLDGLGRRFGYLGMVRYAWRALLAKLRIRPMTGGTGNIDDKNARAMFCSWYVAAVFQEAGFDVGHDLEHSLTSPKDIAQSDATKYAGTVHWDPDTARDRIEKSVPNLAEQAA